VRVTPQLDILDTVFISNVDGGQNIPSVVFNGADYIVAFLDARLTKGIVASRVSPAGVVMDTGYTVNDGNNYPAAVPGAGRTLVLWSREFDAVCGRFVDGQAVPQDTVMRIAAISASAARPAAAFDGSNYLVVWPDFGTTGTLDIFGRILIDGTPVDTPMVLVQGPEAENNPDIVFDGENYFLVWESGMGQVRGLILDRAAKPITGPVVLSDTAFHLRQRPAAAAGLGCRFCFWSEYNSDYDIYGAIVHDIGIAAGGMGSPGIITIAPNPFRRATRISAGIRSATQFGGEGSGISIYDISGRLIRSFSLPIPSEGRGLSSPWDGTTYSLLPTVVWDGTDQTGHAVPPGVYFVRLSAGSATATVKIVKIE